VGVIRDNQMTDSGAKVVFLGWKVSIVVVKGQTREVSACRIRRTAYSEGPAAYDE
jgi:hypothetical protein